jgi:hypothetical protein
MSDAGREPVSRHKQQQERETGSTTSSIKLSARPPASSAGHDLDLDTFVATRPLSSDNCYWGVVSRLYSC